MLRENSDPKYFCHFLPDLFGPHTHTYYSIRYCTDTVLYIWIKKRRYVLYVACKPSVLPRTYIPFRMGARYLGMCAHPFLYTDPSCTFVSFSHFRAGLGRESLPTIQEIFITDLPSSSIECTYVPLSFFLWLSLSSFVWPHFGGGQGQIISLYIIPTYVSLYISPHSVW